MTTAHMYSNQLACFPFACVSVYSKVLPYSRHRSLARGRHQEVGWRDKRERNGESQPNVCC